MPRALVTGPRDLLGSAGAALGRAGFDVGSGEAPPPDGLFDCYVQLPGAGRPAPVVGPTSDLIDRIDALAAVAGRLRADASVILGVDDATDLLAAVALALLEDLGRSATRLVVLPVADLCRPPDAAPPRAVQWEMPTPPLVSAP